MVPLPVEPQPPSEKIKLVAEMNWYAIYGLQVLSFPDVKVVLFALIEIHRPSPGDAWTPSCPLAGYSCENFNVIGH